MERLVASLGQTPSSQIYYETICLSDVEAIQQFVRHTLEHFGTIDILINNVGLNNARGEVTSLNANDLDWMMAINFRAPLIFMQEVGKHMLEKHEGFVVNVLSTVCLFSNEGIGGYTASKAALDALTKVFRKEVRKHNIRVLSVYPGGVDTPFREADRPEYLDSEQVANTLVNALKTEKNVALDELVFRPMVERNF